MGLLSWLFGRAAKVDTPVPDPTDHVRWNLDALPNRQPPPKWQPKPENPEIRVGVTLTAGPAAPQQPAPDKNMVLQDTVQLGDLHVAIEYRDADGQRSTRNITMQEVGRGPNAPVIKAICHTRRAVRHFRTDRIINVVTSDGEVLTADHFFRNVLRIDLSNLAAGVQEDSLKTARALRDFLRPALSILVVAARTDDEFHPAELAAIMDYVRAEVPFLLEYEKFTKPVGQAELNLIETLIRTMRPQESSVRSYLSAVMSQREERFLRFRAALLAVVRADGIVRLPEEVFLDDLDRLRVQVALENQSQMVALGLDEMDDFHRPINQGRLFNPDRE